MHASKWYWIGAALLVLAVFAMAQQPAPTQAKIIKHVAVKPTSPASGQEMFTSYCAVCHGTDGKGNGPAASALKVPPADLTALAQKDAGKYPAMMFPACCGATPSWPPMAARSCGTAGPRPACLSQGHDSEVQQRIANLNDYVESIQKK